MDKPFKTYNQQLKILRDRNMIIKDGSKAIKVLKREDYYNIINGYKDIFLDSSATVETYKAGTEFEQLHALFEFDRNLRGLFLKYILKLESIIKTKISYHFSNKYRTPFNYLNTSNFKKSNLSEVTTLISRISATVEKNTKNDKGQVPYYLNTYENLPLWVLMKKLDFGAAAYFYNALQDNLKCDICEEIINEYKKEYKLQITIPNEYDQLCKILFFVNKFRNTCAHDERLYNLSITSKNLKFQHFYRVGSINTASKSKLIDLLFVLKLFLTKKDFKKLVSLLKSEFDDLSGELPSNIFNLVQISMGFPKAWEAQL